MEGKIKLKVLLLTKMFPRIGNDSFGSYVYEQVREIEKRNIKMIVVSPQVYIPKIFAIFGGKLKKYAEAPTEYNYKEFHVYAPKCLWLKEFLNKSIDLKYKIFRWSLFKTVRRFAENIKPDIIYGIDPLMDGRLCVELGKVLDIPVVLIEHSVPSNYRDFINNKNAQKIYKKVCENSDKIVFVTHRQRDLFFELLNPKCNDRVILNGYKNENINLTLTPPKLKDKKIKMVTIGFLEDRKGYKIIFEALKLLKNQELLDFSLVIIGDGYNRQAYENIVKQYGLDQNVVFKGIIPHEKVFEILNKNDIFVLPSYNEAFGISYLEAMSCGLLIIGTENEGISDIIVNGKNGYLIPKNDYIGLAKLLMKIKDNPDTAQRIALNGFNTVKNYGWDRNAQEMVELFDSVLIEHKWRS